jgi:hypothetical protein
MNPDAKECFDTAANLLQQVTGCQPSVAAAIVESIALGAIRWEISTYEAQKLHNQAMFDAQTAAYENGEHQ